MSLVVGVDSSTQSTKVEVRDLDSGTVVARGSNPHPATTPPRSEQHPDAWWDALAPLLDEHAAEAAAISVAGQQHGMVVLGADLRVLRPAKLWNDTESDAQSRELVGKLGADRWVELCGTVPVPAITVTKLAWLREHEPHVYQQIARVLLPHDWLTLRLTGAVVTDRGDASGTGYWSPAVGEWVPEILDLVGLDPSVCPTVLGPTDAAGTWRGAVVGPGTGDNMAAALGLGLRPGDLAISIGTSGTVYAVTDRPAADPTGAVAGFADATGHFLPLVCTLNATKVTDAVARLLGASHEELAQLALSAPPGAGGLVLVPYLDGERTPNRPDATGMLTGLRSDVSRAQLARAAFEGVVCGLLDGVEALSAAGIDARTAANAQGRVFVLGGGARSIAFVRVLTDLLQRPVLAIDGEHVAAGACVQAAAVLTGREPADVAVTWGFGQGTPVDPDPRVDAEEVRGAYAAAAQRLMA